MPHPHPSPPPQLSLALSPPFPCCVAQKVSKRDWCQGAPVSPAFQVLGDLADKLCSGCGLVSCHLSHRLWCEQRSEEGAVVPGFMACLGEVKRGHVPQCL